MKKLLIASALMATLVTAHAQSSLTLYGRIDNGIEYMSGIPGANGGHTSRWRAESGDWGTSLWGLMGSEDIGAGTKIIFKLEKGFNAMTGAASNSYSFFERYAYVGAQNDTYGTLTAGRMLWIDNGLWDFDPFGQTNWSSASLVRGRDWNETSNNIAYQSPKWGGFDVAARYALSNSTHWNAPLTSSTVDPLGQGRSVGLQATYTASLFQVRGIYDEVRNPETGQFDNVFSYSREYFAGLNVFLGQFKVQAVYQASHAPQAASGAPTVTQQEWGGLTWQASPAAALIAAVYHVNANNGGGSGTLYTIGGSYNLSKRTLLDVQIATVRNSRGANFSLEANSVTSADNPTPGRSQSGFYAGIQHSF